MKRWQKREQVRRMIEEATTLEYLARETLVREWMQAEVPLATIEESIEAGFIYPDADNPHLMHAHETR
jgi:hypothetical protein